jgi:hypothetical protein
MALYSAVYSADAAKHAAASRLKRLNKPSNLWIVGMTIDIILSAGPWILGVAIAASGINIIYTEVSGAEDIFALFNAPVAINAISTFSSFLLVGKQSLNLANNATIIREFGNLSGSLVNICLFLKSQMSSGKSIEFLTLSDGKGGSFRTTRVGLACASAMFIVKYTGRGTIIVPESLPLGQDDRLLTSYKSYISPSNGSPGMPPFMACILMIGELIDEFQMGEKPSEYAVLFGQINAVTAAEGSISEIAKYGQPYLMKYLIYVTCSLYILIVVTNDLVPNNRWHSVWIGVILAFTTVCFYQISERYRNPMKLRSRTMGQKPFISFACINTEIAITSIFARSKSTLIGVGETAVLPMGMRFNTPNSQNRLYPTNEQHARPRS